MAYSIAGLYLQARTLARVAEVLAGAGQYQQAAAAAGQAERVAGSITDPARQAQVLAQVAEVLARTGDTRSACRVAAVTCTVGRWTIAARPVLLLAPPHLRNWQAR